MAEHSTQQPSPDHRAIALFEKQYGLAADRQLRAVGITWGRQQRMIDCGRLHRFAPGVVAVAGSPPTWRQRAMAATLSQSSLALLSGASAARLHKFDGFLDVDAVEIVLPFGGHSHTLDDVRVRRSRKLSKADRHVVDGIPVTIQPVTLIHLAVDGLNAAKALDSALRQRKPPLWFKQNFERWQSPYTIGPSAMLLLLDDRVGKRLPRSWFQHLAKRLLETEGIRMADEWPVSDSSLLAELDLADVTLKVGVECQSIEYHDAAADRARDVRRKRMLRRLGWTSSNCGGPTSTDSTTCSSI